MKYKFMKARMSTYFFEHGLTLDGISHEVVDGKLIIKIDSTKHTIEIRTNSSGFTFFNIYNDLFWVKKVYKYENTTEYEVSDIVQHGPDVKFNESSTQKVSDLFTDVVETDYITVIV